MDHVQLCLTPSVFNFVQCRQAVQEPLAHTPFQNLRHGVCIPSHSTFILHMVRVGHAKESDQREQHSWQ